MIHSDRTILARLTDVLSDLRDIERRLPYVGTDTGGLHSRLTQAGHDLHYVIQDIEFSNRGSRGNTDGNV